MLGGIPILKYDPTNPTSIESYGKKLIGKTFLEVIKEANISFDEQEKVISKYGNPKRKGGLGNLLEKYYFEYEINSDQEADFPEAGVELKVSAYQISKKGNYSAGERLVITMISYDTPVEITFNKSHVFNKMQLMLIIYYLRNRELNGNLVYPIDFVTLFSPPDEDMKIIEQDYLTIINKIQSGKAHELSEADTMYLGACTKGSNAEKSTVPQLFYAPNIKARKRAFSLKSSYMTYVLNNYIRKDINTYESILNNSTEIENETFEHLIMNKINQHRGKSDQTLCQEFGIEYQASSEKNLKGLWSILSYRMLGIKSNRAEEFEKAGIEVRTIRIEENGKMNESISFPSIELRELAASDWEESILFNDLESKRYLFVVFKKNGKDYFLKGCQLWNMPRNHLDLTVKEEWEAIKEIVREGVILSKKFNKNGSFRVTNNFPSKNPNGIIHVRPHTSNRYYDLRDGEIIGDNPSNGDELPDGRIMTKQSFWLNNNYILRQLNEELK